MENELRVLKKKYRTLSNAYNRLIEQYQNLEYDYNLTKDLFGTLAIHNLQKLYTECGIIKKRGTVRGTKFK